MESIPPPPSHPEEPSSADHADALGAPDVAPGAGADALRDDVQPTLPFGPDEPIPFRLTVRARRAVAPDDVPPLRVVEARERPRTQPRDLDDPHDTRPSQARALRRAGLSFAQIGHELDEDPLVVQAWVDDVTPVASARRRLRAVHDRLAPGGDAAHDADARIAFERHRAAARSGAAETVLADEGASRRVALLAGLVTATHHAATLSIRDPELARAVVPWVVASTEVDLGRVRVLLRIAPQVAGDEAAHRWAEACGLDVDRVAFSRWREAPDAAAVAATVRLAGPEVAGTVAGWVDALLDGLLDRPGPSTEF